MVVKVHSIKAWLFGSAAACVLGLTLFVAGYKSFLFPSAINAYISYGIELPGEPSNIFEEYYAYLNKRESAGEIDDHERQKLILEYSKRQRIDTMTTGQYRGQYFSIPVKDGTRTYKFSGSAYSDSPPNRILMVIGSLLTFSGVFGFFVEFRLRIVKV